MDYAEMVSQIMAAEQGAKALADEAREKRQQMEDAAAQEALTRLDERLDRTMKAVEASYEKNKERWVDALFSMIVGVEPS